MATRKRKTARESLDPEARDILEAGQPETRRQAGKKPAVRMVTLSIRVEEQLAERLDALSYARKRSRQQPRG